MAADAHGICGFSDLERGSVGSAAAFYARLPPRPLATNVCGK
mgnify:CR=1 FL=1